MTAPLRAADRRRAWIGALVFLVALGAIVVRSNQAPGSDTYEGIGRAFTPEERAGRDTWHFWTAGNERFWRRMAQITEGNVDTLMYVDSRLRDRRFHTLGSINHPGCRAATTPDEQGLWMDDCSNAEPVERMPGAPTGVIGLRRFANPHFKADAWSVESYRKDRTVEPPYLIGMSCGFCHIGFNPIAPPADVENPTWANLAPTIGNQYFEEGKLFTLNMSPTDFRWHVGQRQPPGTSDTSRFATDHINNPNTINAMFNLSARRSHPERMADGTTQEVPRVLKDGGDSVGLTLASLRVFVNIGMCGDYWITRHDPVAGLRPQQPFEISHARTSCEAWRETEARMPAMLAFLMRVEPLRLRDAPGGERFLPRNEAELRRGKVVFAENCASCHSGKQPASDVKDRNEWFRRSVLGEDFLDGNFLSDDQRYPVQRIGTNVARAAATNATRGHIWAEFSSETYKSQPAVGKIRGLYNPRHPTETIDIDMVAGGTGYYRTPSLVSLWATAPYLHNNSVGVYIKDPSVAGRMTAFYDGIEKLLWPERRLGASSVQVTSIASTLRLSSGYVLNVPAGTPIDLIARVDPNRIPRIMRSKRVQRLLPNSTLYRLMERNNLVPDFINDRGHTFGSALPDEDKRALIEVLKTL